MMMLFSRNSMKMHQLVEFKTNFLITDHKHIQFFSPCTNIIHIFFFKYPMLTKSTETDRKQKYKKIMNTINLCKNSSF